MFQSCVDRDTLEPRCVRLCFARASENLCDSARQKGKKGKEQPSHCTREATSPPSKRRKRDGERKGAEFSCEFFLRPLSAFTLRFRRENET